MHDSMPIIASIRGERRDPAVRHEHLAEFEADEPLDAFADRSERSDPAGVVERVEPVRREDHRRAASGGDRVTRREVAVEVEGGARLVGDVGAGNEVRQR